jgi:cupin fold WbuC family metalloprotein
MNAISLTDLKRLTNRARERPRRRINLNLHPRLDDPIQRFFNCMEPGSYVRPHRHTDPPRWEVFVALAGRAMIIEFSADGKVLERTEISPSGPDVAVEIPGGSWHTVVPTEPATILFELKPGPYIPLSDKDFAPWAPVEGDPDQARFVGWMQTAAPGDGLD